MASALLMAIAPVVSYTLQALGPVQEITAGHGADTRSKHHAMHGRIADVATAASAHKPPAATPSPPGHAPQAGHPIHHAPALASSASVQDTHTAGAIAADHAQPAANPHADHGAACDYCLIAARALAVIAALLWLLLVPAAGGLRPTGAALHRTTRQPWPAHAARGPPLIA